MAQEPNENQIDEEPEYNPDDDTEQSGILSVTADVRRTPDLIPSPAPRNVPVPLQARIYFGSSVIQGAWAFLTISMIFVWYWLPYTDLTSWYYFPNASNTTTVVSGEVKRVEQVTGFKIKRAGAVLDLGRITYSYTGKPGTPEAKTIYEAVAYTPDPYAVGDIINNIEYLPNAPHIARIQDSLRKPYGPSKAIIALIPLFCLIVILAHMVAAFKHLRLLSHGNIALSQVKHTEKAINKQTKTLQHRYTVQFIAANGKRYKARCFSDRPTVNNPDALPVLYRPKNPGRSAHMLDALPGRPHLTSDGKFKDSGNGIFYLLLPLLSFILNLALGIWAMNQ